MVIAMAGIREIFWRQVTDADFVCVERSTEHTPVGGGGQTYFSLSFGAHLDKEEFGQFLALDPPTLILTERPPIPIEAAVLGEPSEGATIEFRPRYQDPADRRDRYYIARQNRQRENQRRHPAWTAARGFPEAPNDVADKTDPRMPDLSLLKLIVARADDGAYFADYVNADRPPRGTPAALGILFEANAEVPPDGLIPLADGELEAAELAAIVRSSHERPRDAQLTSAEIEDAREATARAAGARGRSGQGFRQSAEQRTAIDRHAMRRATDRLEAEGWEVEDRSVNHPYDLFCSRDREELRVEVKGTTSDGAAVLLTPNEVEHARATFPAVALLVVHGVELSTDGDGEAVATGGEIDLVSPWEIDAQGTLKPTGFSYERTR
jgi:Domain of unknown function (DUF3883)